MKRYFRKDRRTRKKANTLLKDIGHEFGWKTRILGVVTGIYVYFSIKREERSLARGKVWEPDVCYEKNQAALALESQKQEAKIQPDIMAGGLLAAPRISGRGLT